MAKPKLKHSFRALTFFLGVLASLIVYIFYATEVRYSLETLLFDVRTRLKPQSLHSSQVAVVTLGQGDLEYIQQRYQKKRASIQALQDLTEALQRSQIEAAAFILPHQDYNYVGPRFKQLITTLKENKNIYLGIFDYHHKEPSKVTLPENFEPIIGQVAGAGTMRNFRQGVIRSTPLVSYLLNSLVAHLPTVIALNHSQEKQRQHLVKTLSNKIQAYNTNMKHRKNDLNAVKLPSVKINYWSPKNFTSISAKQLLQQGSSSLLKNKIVLIGYTVFRHRDLNYRDGTLVNTPWLGEENPEKKASPLIWVQASMVDNLVNSSWLQQSSWIFNLSQTILCTLLSFLIWRLTPTLASILFLSLMLLLTYTHAICLSYLSLLPTMADTLLFSILAAIGSAFIKSQKNRQQRVRRQHKAQFYEKLSALQSRFLNRFAFDLHEKNQNILHYLNEHHTKFVTPNTKTQVSTKDRLIQQTLQKSLTSCEELNDYLCGIKEYTLLQQKNFAQPKKQTVRLQPLIQKILDQFEHQLNQNQISVKLKDPKYLSAQTDEVLLETILFNLISNAIKYSPCKSIVYINLNPYGRKQVHIEVCDQGPGIAQDFHKKIFEKFYRVQDDQVYKIKGNGLGLYLCQFFASKMHTQIELISDLGYGSKFSLKLQKG